MFNFDRALNRVLLEHLGSIYTEEANTYCTGSDGNGLSYYIWRLINNGMEEDKDNLRMYIKNTNNKQLSIESLQMSKPSICRNVLLADLMNK